MTLTNELAEPGEGIRGSYSVVTAYSVEPVRTVFRNRGIVAASTGTVAFEEHVNLTDQKGALWSVDECKVEMSFRHDALFLNGDFSILTLCGGHFDFQAFIATCGTYTRQTGSLFVFKDGAFMYQEFDDTGGCGNPGQRGGSGPKDCEDLFTVPADSYLACCLCP